MKHVSTALAVALLSSVSMADSLTGLGCDGDCTQDGQVNVDDLLIVIAYYGLLEPAAGDVNLDGQVDSEDILGVLDQWGTCDEP